MGNKIFSRANPALKQIETYHDFSGGLNTELADSATKDNQFREIVNFDIDKAGNLTKRPGLYRIPLVDEEHQDLIFDKINDIINKQLVVFDGKPPSITTLKINDVIHFFDGQHWVFNYLTTWGLFVICLDKNMRVISLSETQKELGETISDLYIQFYPHTKELNTPVKYKNKITKFNDTFYLIKSLYDIPKTVGQQSEDDNQVFIYTWNPIYKVENKKATHKPGWIEASKKDDESTLINISDYGESEFRATQSKTLKALTLSKYFEILDISYYDNGIDRSCYLPVNDDLHIYLEEHILGCNLVKVYKNQVTKTPILHQNQDPVYPAEIAQVIINRGLDENEDITDNKWKIIVYLKNKSKTESKYDDTYYFFAIVYNINSVAPYDFEKPFFLKRVAQCMVNEQLDNYGQGPKNDFTIEKQDWRYRQLLQINTIVPAQKEDGFNRASKIIVTNYGAALYQDYFLTVGRNLNFAPRDNWYISGATSYVDRQNGFKINDNYPYEISANKPNFGILESAPKDYAYMQSDYGYMENIFYSPEVPSMRMTPREWYYEWWYTYPEHDVLQKVKFVGYKLKTKLFNRYNPSDGTCFQLAGYLAQIFGIDPSSNWSEKEGSNKIAIKTNSNVYYQKALNDVRFEYDIKDLETYRTAIGRTSRWSRSGFQTCYINMYLARLQNNSNIENSLFDSNTFGFGCMQYKISYKDNPNAPQKSLYLKTALIEGDTFNFYSPTLNHLDNLFHKNKLNFDTIDWLRASDFFDNYDPKFFDNLLKSYLEGKTNLLRFAAVYSSNNKQHYLDLELKPFEVVSFIEAMKSPNPIGVSMFYLKGKLVSVKLYWNNPNRSGPVLLLEVSSRTIRNFDSVSEDILNSLRFYVNYEYLPKGVAEQVFTFKQEKYTKPNLNDLSYLWYNFTNMSIYNPKTWPDIYDPLRHKNVSNALIKYPESDLKGARPVEIFGLVPVNNVVLQPGRQRFQLFYTTNKKEEELSKLKAAITAMSVDDYTSMINSNDYSTTGYIKNPDKPDEEKPTIGPAWTTFDSIFTDYDDDPKYAWGPEQNGKKVGKRAVFDLDIPSTTSPYMVLVQIAEYDEEKSRIRLATVTETKIQMQPDGASIPKINITGLFDEFVTTVRLTNYNSHLIAYGGTNKLYFSDVSAPTYFPLSRVVQLPTPESVKDCTIFQNKLIVSTENARFYVGGSSFDNPEDPFVLREVSSDSGTLASKSVVPMGNYLYFLDNSGVKILKNLFGTADKEFSYETIDTEIKSVVPRSRNAAGTAYRDKYYLCFPDENDRKIFVYNFNYKSWTVYESNYFDFALMFVNDDKLYGVSRETFNIYEFRDDVFIDNWNGYDGFEYITENEIKTYVQKGTLAQAIECRLETKALDQNYSPHQKKYEYALFDLTITGLDTVDEFSRSIEYASTGNLIPYVKVDNDLINYKFSTKSNTENVWFYQKDDPLSIPIYNNSVISQTSIVSKSNLGDNQSSYYYVPVAKTGDRISFGLRYTSATGLVVNAVSIKYGIRTPKFNRRGIS